MKYYLKYNELREQVDIKYQKMGYDRARELIKFFSEAELITLPDRTNLMEYLNLVYKLDKDIKSKKRKTNKRRKNKLND